MQSWLSILDHAVPFTLVCFRMLGLFLAAPLLSSVVIPRRTKILLAIMISAAVYPMLRIGPGSPALENGKLEAFTLIPMVVAESLIGYVIGMIASIPMTALEMSGLMMGHQMGLGLSRVYNPETDYDVDVLGQLLFYVATGVFFAMGGLETLMRSLLGTFQNLPIGGTGMGKNPLEILLGVVQSSFDLALRVSSPVAGIVLLLVIVFAAIGKTMPQINIMSVGFTFKILAGVLILAAALYSVQAAAGDVIAEALRQVRLWAAGGIGR